MLFLTVYTPILQTNELSGAHSDTVHSKVLSAIGKRERPKKSSFRSPKVSQRTRSLNQVLARYTGQSNAEMKSQCRPPQGERISKDEDSSQHLGLCAFSTTTHPNEERTLASAPNKLQAQSDSELGPVKQIIQSPAGT